MLTAARWAPLTWLLAGTLLLHGCASAPTATRAEAAQARIAVGMRRGEVLAALGQPWKVLADPSGVLWTYRFEEDSDGGLVALYVVGMCFLVLLTVGIVLIFVLAGGGGHVGGGNLPDGPDAQRSYLRVHLSEGRVDWTDLGGR